MVFPHHSHFLWSKGFTFSYFTLILVVCLVKNMPVLSDVISLTTNRLKDYFIAKWKEKKLGLKGRSFFRTFEAWLSFHLCLINFIVLSHWHLHWSRSRSCLKMKQEQDKTPLLEQGLISPQRGSTCKTLLLKEMLGHSSTFVLHLHVWQDSMKTEEISVLSSSLRFQSVPRPL